MDSAGAQVEMERDRDEQPIQGEAVASSSRCLHKTLPQASGNRPDTNTSSDGLAIHEDTSFCLFFDLNG
jgi:hypothetical protein